jgi:hypothetical protein
VDQDVEYISYSQLRLSSVNTVSYFRYKEDEAHTVSVYVPPGVTGGGAPSLTGAGVETIVAQEGDVFIT